MRISGDLQPLIYTLYFISTLLYFIYFIHIHLYSLFSYILSFCSFICIFTIYFICIMSFFILFSYLYSHKHIKTHHEFNIFILVTQCQDCGDTWCYDNASVSFLDLLLVHVLLCLRQHQGRVFLLKPQMLFYQFFSHYCLVFLYFRL